MNENQFRLDNRRMLLTGAAGGIGRSIAAACGALGAEIVLTDVSCCVDLRDTLRAIGIRAEARCCDVTDRVAVETMCAELGPFDACVLNAGINPYNDWLAADWNDTFRSVMDVNVLGALNIARATLPGLAASGNGCIVLTSSVSGFTGGGTFASTPPHYVISKGGLHTFMRWLARVGGERVRVNAVAPSVVDVGLGLASGVPYAPPDHQIIRRMATAEEVAWPIAFLCSPAASYITGAVLDVNGGNYLR